MFARSLQQAVRRLSRSRAFTVAAWLTLVVGLGSAITIFSVVNAVLLQPLPYPQSNRLVSLSHTLEVHGALRVDQSDASLLFYGRHVRTLTDIGGYQAGAAAFAPDGVAEPERVAIGRVTAGVLSALRVVPLVGRLITTQDEDPQSNPVVLLSERLWVRRFGADVGVVHRRVTIDGVPHEVIGIVPDTVRFPASDTEAWLPLRLNPAKTDSASFDYQGLARLANGVTPRQAEDDLDALLPQLPDEFPGRMSRASIAETRMRPSVRPLAAVMTERAGPLLWTVFGVSIIALGGACVTVLCLFLVRAEHRRPMLVLQRWLGAPRMTILLESFSEIVLLTGLGGLGGLWIARLTAHVIRSEASVIAIPRLAEVDLDPAVWRATGLAVMLIALLIGLAMAWRLKETTAGVASVSRAATTGRAQHRALYALVAAHVALTMILVIAAGLMAKTLWNLRHVEPGFSPAAALTFRLAIPRARYPTARNAVRMVTRVLEAVSRVPGAGTVAAASKLPLEEETPFQTAVFIEGQMREPGALPRIHPVAYVTPAYFVAMRIPILDGQTFQALDPSQPRLETIVSHAFAERYWPGASAIGQHIRLLANGPVYTVIGVAANVRDAALDRPADALIYCPLLPPAADTRWDPRDVAFVVRAGSDPTNLVAAVRSAVGTVDSTLPVYGAQALSDVVAHAMATRRLVLLLVSTAAVIALLLSAIGLYGVTAYVVSLRTREIGIRLALGQPATSVAVQMAQRGGYAALIGMAAGVFALLGLTSASRALLFRVAPSDPVVVSLSAVLVFGLVVLASWIACRRATAIDAWMALQAE